MALWWNGRHGRFKICYLRVCEFDSRWGHHSATAENCPKGQFLRRVEAVDLESTQTYFYYI